MSPDPALTAAQRLRLEAILKSRIAELQRRSAVRLHGASQVQEAQLERLQDADDASERAGAHEVDGIVSDIDSVEFNALTSALQRIHGVGYGVCVDGQEPIPFARLEVEPQALRCTACQALHERQMSI